MAPRGDWRKKRPPREGEPRREERREAPRWREAPRATEGRGERVPRPARGAPRANLPARGGPLARGTPQPVLHAPEPRPEPAPREEAAEALEEVEPEYALPADVKRQRLVKASAPGLEGWGKPPAARSIEELLRTGVVNLDKPRGPTSHQVVAWLRDALGIEKVGHGGTLDPKVTGVLPTCLGDATKAVKALLGAGKEYVCVMRLHASLPASRVKEVAEALVGEVTQVPPVRAAVARRPRRRRIYYLHVLEVDGRDALFRIGCEAGTYVRNECVDIGRALGTRAHMQELRRTRSGGFTEREAVPLVSVTDAFKDWKATGDETGLRRVLLPMERILDHVPKVVVRDSAVDALCHGAPLAMPGVLEADSGLQRGGVAAAFTAKGEAVALLRAAVTSQEMVERDRGLAARVERVLMPKGTYPPMWKPRATTGRS